VILGFFVYRDMKRTKQTWRKMVKHFEEVMNGRVPLSHDEFGENFFSGRETQIASKIRELMEEIVCLDLSRAHPDDEMASDLGLTCADPLDADDVINDLEEEYNISLDEESCAKALTIRDLVQLVIEQLNKKSAAL
jgi:acyl carrier protein